jgi:hypothetical protein
VVDSARDLTPGTNRTRTIATTTSIELQKPLTVTQGKHFTEHEFRRIRAEAQQTIDQLNARDYNNERRKNEELVNMVDQRKVFATFYKKGSTRVDEVRSK